MSSLWPNADSGLRSNSPGPHPAPAGHESSRDELLDIVLSRLGQAGFDKATEHLVIAACEGPEELARPAVARQRHARHRGCRLMANPLAPT